MNNKYKIFGIGAVAAGMMLASCSESFLDVESKTESNTENFYKTEGDAYRALIGCYDGWRRIVSSPQIGILMASTIMSDETYGATGNGDGRGYQVVDRFDLNQSPADLNLYESDWARYYEAIYRINALVQKEGQIEWKSDATRGLYMGEVRALRAICYFDMVRMWENIPLLLEPTDGNVPQADPDDVYAAIFADLKYAIANIPADAYPKAMAATNDGHVTRYAAEAIMARAYLFYTGYYGKEHPDCSKQDAVAALDDIIKSGEFSLVPDFKDLWPAASLVPVDGTEPAWDETRSTYAGEANPEILLQMKFTPTQDYNGNDDSNRILVMFGMRSLYKAPYGKGWGAATVCPGFVEKMAGDPRFKASVIDIDGEGVSKQDAYAASYSDWREYTGYCIKKYSPLCFNESAGGSYQHGSKADGTGDFQITNPNNWIIMRYADVLLMAAELGGVPSKGADACLNEVRKRAGLDSKTATKENVMEERALELAFEGHRYYDLLRQGVDYAASVIAASSGMTKSAGKDDMVTIKAADITAKRGLMQIPTNQIILSNGVLKQNPGWE